MTALDTLQAEYAALCAKRDAVNLVVAPLQDALDAANAQAEEARLRGNDLAAQISQARGGAQWLDLKKQIGAHANAIMALKRARG